jgi:ABC-type uncharacterized transport system substrate-binding protein
MVMTHADRFLWEQQMLATRDLTLAQKNILPRLSLYLNIKTGQCNPSVIFTSGDDPVVTGLVASLARPGQNLTGVSFFVVELHAKRLK